MFEFGSISSALLGAVAYGSADYFGGRATRRLTTSSAVALAQVVAVVFMLYWVKADSSTLPVGPHWWSSFFAGMAYVTGLMLLYHGFAYGRIGIVAPLCGLFSILVPLLADVALSRLISDRQLLGIALAAGSIVLISYSAGGGSWNGNVRFSVRFGVLSGLCYGFADVCLGLMPVDSATGSLFVARCVAAVAAMLVVAYTLIAVSGLSKSYAASPSLAQHRPHDMLAPQTSGLQSVHVMSIIRIRNTGLVVGVALAIVAGVFDTLGHLGYVYAATLGSMSVAAALVALFPAVSVLLAVVLLNERIGRLQFVGLVSSGASVTMLAM